MYRTYELTEEEKNKITRMRWDGDTHYYDVFESQEECDEEEKRLAKIEEDYRKEQECYLNHVKNMRVKEKSKRDYYAEIDKALRSYENNKPWHDKSIEWICGRIDWCWKFRHMTEKQMEELVERVCAVMHGEY